MSLSEFTIIEKYFAARASIRTDVVLGIGDDAAVLEVPDGMGLVATTDTLVEGIHFLPDTDARAIGHKSLAVSLSDLAAMGAQPAWATLNLTLPSTEESWLEAFAEGFFNLSERYGVELVGGDVTRGPLATTVQALGVVPRGELLRRATACAGDRIIVTGSLGDAALGLRALRRGVSNDSAPMRELLNRLHFPEPRIAHGTVLRDVASAAIDISDGLLADLGHIISQSGCGAELNVDRVPLSGDYNSVTEQLGIMARTPEAFAPALTGGDDYELCFTVPPDRMDMLAGLQDLPVPCTEIGVIQKEPGLLCLDHEGRTLSLTGSGYDHFG